MRRFPRPSWLPTSVLPILLAVPGAAHEVLVRPEAAPLEGEPFEVTFLGEWGYYFPLFDQEPGVSVDGSTIRIDAWARYPPILPPLETYAVTVQIPPLPAGEYLLELHPDEHAGARATYRIEVLVRDVELEPLVSPLVAGEPARIRVSGASTCLVDADQVPEVADGRILVEIADGCPVDPPLSFEVFVETPPLGAGEYRILAVDPLDRLDFVRGSADLQVLPPPAVRDGRFRLSVDWTNFEGQSGIGRPVSEPGPESALFWFFEPENWELMVKVLDGCALNGHYWVFTAASTNVGYTLRVDDGQTAMSWTTTNSLGVRSPATTDTRAFPCDQLPGAGSAPEVSR